MLMLNFNRDNSGKIAFSTLPVSDLLVHYLGMFTQVLPPRCHFGVVPFVNANASLNHFEWDLPFPCCQLTEPPLKSSTVIALDPPVHDPGSTRVDQHTLMDSERAVAPLPFTEISVATGKVCGFANSEDICSFRLRTDGPDQSVFPYMAKSEQLTTHLDDTDIKCLAGHKNPEVVEARDGRHRSSLESFRPLLTAEEVALELRCSRAHVYNILGGKVLGLPPLPAIRLGRRTLIRRTALQEWLLQVEVGVQAA